VDFDAYASSRLQDYGVVVERVSDAVGNSIGSFVTGIVQKCHELITAVPEENVSDTQRGPSVAYDLVQNIGPYCQSVSRVNSF
jgi:hypothetical protein